MFVVAGLMRRQQQIDDGGFKNAYIAPIAKIKATSTFARMLICNFHTRKKGRMAYTQSPTQMRAEYA